MMVIKSYAKVNLDLKVSRLYPKKGLHKINSIFQIVEDLWDEITIKENNLKKDIILCNLKELELNNSVYKVMDILRINNVIDKHYTISINKKIPMGGGLGGSSSNAVAVTKHFTNNKKVYKKIAEVVGTDCYFFFSSFKTARVKAFGNKVKKVNTQRNITKKDLIFTGINCSTKEVYNEFDRLKCYKLKKYKNQLTPAVYSIYPQLKKYDKIGHLSGSGSTFIKKI